MWHLLIIVVYASRSWWIYLEFSSGYQSSSDTSGLPPCSEQINLFYLKTLNVFVTFVWFYCFIFSVCWSWFSLFFWFLGIQQDSLKICFMQMFCRISYSDYCGLNIQAKIKNSWKYKGEILYKYIKIFKTLAGRLCLMPIILSYSGGRDQEDCGSMPTQANSLQKLISKKPNTKQGWWSESSGRVPARQAWGPKFKLQNSPNNL
jgi:hypothetical protein